MSGYAYEELIGMNGLSLISDETRDTVIGNIEAEYEKPYEAVGIRKDGSRFALQLEARTIPYKGKSARVVEFRDISAAKQAEKEKEDLENTLRQAQKLEAVGRLAGGVAHDFNNLLGLIIGSAEMGLEDTPTASPLRPILEEIKIAGERSAQLTKQLLAFARKQTVMPRVIDINSAIGTMTEMLRRLAGENITLVWNPGKDIWPVRMDEGQVDQILANLCLNARDAIANIGEVTITTANVTLTKECQLDQEIIPQGRYVCITIRDTGAGMSPETKEKVFEPFFTTKEQGRGTGLGLATVYGIVKQNNGYIHVVSAPGSGTTFAIYLPRHQREVGRGSAKGGSQETPHGKETILLVEDDHALLAMTTRMLERLGYTVIGARSPNEAIDLARQCAGDIDLLLTDVIMPEMNGRDLAQKIVTLYPAIKLLFMSGYTADIIAHHGVLEEGMQFIHKPFARQELGLAVRNVLDKETGREKRIGDGHQ